MVRLLLGLAIGAVVLDVVAVVVWVNEGVDCPAGECPTAGEVAGLSLLPLFVIAVVAAVAALVVERRRRRRDGGA